MKMFSVRKEWYSNIKETRAFCAEYCISIDRIRSLAENTTHKGNEKLQYIRCWYKFGPRVKTVIIDKLVNIYLELG